MAARHQVPSTTHLDSLLVCKAKGMRLRQIVLLQPCLMLHQRHPAPMQPLRYILPGWDLSDSRCSEKADQAAAFLAQSVTTPPPCYSPIHNARISTYLVVLLLNLRTFASDMLIACVVCGWVGGWGWGGGDTLPGD